MKLTTVSKLITVFALIIFHIDVIISSCGRRLVHHKALIANGFETAEGDWPWHSAIFHVGLNVDIKYKCGGTVITKKSILTAAHCVYEYGRPIIAERVLVELGKHNLINSGSNSQQFQAFNIIPHPNYNIEDLSDDIGIIRLSTEATFNKYVQPICLWAFDKSDISQIVGSIGTVVGFGLTETGKISYTLRQAAMPIVSHNTCLKSNRPLFGSYLSENTFCAGFRNG